MAHLNLKAIDFDKIQQLILEGVEQYVTIQQFERESVDDVLAEGVKLLDAKMPLIKNEFEKFLEETGVSDVYLISYYDLIQEMPAFVVIPTAGMSPEQRENLLEKIDENGMPKSFQVKGLLVIPFDEPRSRRGADLPEYFNAIRAAHVPAFDEAFAGTEKALFRMAVVVPENVTEILTEAGMPMLPIPQVGSLLSLLNDHTRWANAVLDLENRNIRVAVQMSSEESAAEARETLIDLIDMNVGMMTMQMAQQEEMADFMPFVGAYLRGFFRTLLPTVDGDQLVYATSGENGMAAAVGVGGVAVALLLPAVQAAREAARRMQCSNNLKQIGLAMHNYHDAMKTFPPAYTTDKDGKPLHSWRVLILPYIEQQALYSNIRLDEPWDSEYNSQFHDTMVAVYQCPSNRNVTLEANCCYTVVVDDNTVFTGDKPVRMSQIADGTSNTIMVTERLTPVCWMDPTSELTLEEVLEQEGINGDDEGLGSYHTGGVNAAFCDGSVQFLSETIDLETLINLFLRNDGKATHYY